VLIFIRHASFYRIGIKGQIPRLSFESKNKRRSKKEHCLDKKRVTMVNSQDLETKSRFAQQPPIAVVGLGALFPGSLDARSFWHNIMDKSDLITDIPESHWQIADYYDEDPSAPDKTYCKRGGFLPHVPFDTLGFGLPPTLLPSTDTSQLLGLIVARTTLQDALRGQLDTSDRSRISCIMGITSGQELFGQMVSRLRRPEWEAGLRAAGLDEETVKRAADKIGDCFVPWTESSFPGLLGNVVAGRIANRLDLGGTNAVTDAACASSFAAISMGVDELVLGRSDMILTGGVDTLNDIFMYMCFSKTPALSKAGRCRPFDAEGDGTLLGEGLGMIALKRLEDAEAAGDQIYAVIRGIGTSSDGRSKSVYAPVAKGQANAVRRAYDAAGYGPGTVELVEAHGTGTRAGDAAEIEGLKLGFGEADREDKQWCAVGSVKSQIGHTKAAAGAAGILKAVFSLHEKTLPPTANVENPNPNADFPNSPFYINTETRPWIRSSDHPRRASVSSFGFGGSNYHIALEEYCGAGKRPGRHQKRTAELFLFGASTKEALIAMIKGCDGTLAESKSEDDLVNAAKAAAANFDVSSSYRVALIVKNVEDARASFAKAIDGLSSDATPKIPNVYFGEGQKDGKVVFLFSGQGSQYINMGLQLALTREEARSAFDSANDIDFGAAEKQLSDVVFPPSAFTDSETESNKALLTETQWAQPAIGATSLAIFRTLEALKIQPDMVGGHSFGELTALHAAGCYDASSLIRLARKRGELMAASSDIPGGMAAVTGSAHAVQEVLDKHSNGKVVLANHNTPEQSVISGEKSALAAITDHLKEAGMRVRELQVSTAFHSPLVADACKPLASFLEDIDFQAAKIPVFANTTGSPYPTDVTSMKNILANQIGNPVRFVQEVNEMVEAGAKYFVEIGPSNVLTGLVGRILKGQPHMAISTDMRGRDGYHCLLQAIGQLAAAGASLDTTCLYEQLFEQLDLEVEGKRKMEFDVSGSNYGKPDRPEPVAPVAATLPQNVSKSTESKKTPSLSKAPTPLKAEPMNKPSTPKPANRPAGNQTAPAQNMVPAQTAAPAPQTNIAPAAVSAAAPSGWIDVFSQGQQQTAEAHSTFQQSMAQAHVAFLQAFETSSNQLSAMLTGAPIAAAPQAPMAAAPAIQPMATPVIQPMAQPVVAPTPVAAPTQAEVVAPAAAPKAAPSVATPAPQAAAQKVDVNDLLLEVTAEKTGFPKEALSHDMNLEADLGIDSIKRVEILGSMKDLIPGAPDADPMVLSQMSTLGEVAAALAKEWGHLGSSGAPAPASAPAGKTPSVTAAEIDSIITSIVAEQTGYPQEALSLSMELEADLGIDSIKRVEILGALEEKHPELPYVDAKQLATLSTLGDIAQALHAASSDAAGSETAPASTGAESQIDVGAIIIDVVAKQTGYPTDALSLNMELEADLGIDSIKRVEILSTLEEQHPELPYIDAKELAALTTLGAIADALKGQLGSATPAAPAAESPPAPASGNGTQNITDIFLDIVAEKTGYPKEALSLDMELEADLGIDSIKRVEVLGAMKDQVEDLLDLDAMDMAQLTTLGAIANALGGGASNLGKAPSGAAEVQAASSDSNDPQPASTGSAVDITDVFLEIIAEKTGYPKDALNLDMELEADLGIDSIKRVEVLDGLQNRIPELPQLDAMDLAQLTTLGAIAKSLNAGNATSPAPAAEAAPPKNGEAQAADAKIGSGIQEHFPRTKVELQQVATSPAHDLVLSPGRFVAISNDGKGVATALVQALGRRGVQSEVLPENGQIDTSKYCGLILLHGIRDTNSPEQSIHLLKHAFFTLQALSSGITTAGNEGGSFFASVQDLGGDFGLGNTDPNRAPLGGLAGLVKTAQLEWPQVATKAIDVSQEGMVPTQIAETIVNELMQGFRHVEVGIKGGQRAVPAVVRDTLQDGVIPKLKSGAVVVATGGARGVTATCLSRLATIAQPRLVLLGRTELEDEPAFLAAAKTDAEIKGALFADAKKTGEKISLSELEKRAWRVSSNREIRNNIATMEQAGSQVQYLATDVRDPTALQKTLDHVRSTFGPIEGIVHGAGVIADRKIEDKTEEQYDRVFDTKVNGLLSLLDATKNDPISLLCFFSSVAGRYGNIGQVDYSMANEALNKIAQAEATRRAGSCIVKSMAWGPWDGGMVTPSLRKHFEEQEIALLPLDLGAKIFVDELSEEAKGPVEIVIGGPLTEIKSPSPQQSDDPAPHSYTQHVDAKSHAFLADHSIQGTPVVPMVLALQFIAQAATQLNPELKVQSIRNTKVLRGIKLTNFQNGGTDLEIVLTPVEGLIYRAEIKSRAQKVPHYTAEVVMANALQSQPQPPIRASLTPYPVKRDAIYDQFLFHGPQFHLIDIVNGVSPEAMSAQVKGIDAAGWDPQGWIVDAAALDSGLQLVLLFARHVVGGAFLPTGITEYVSYLDRVPAGALRCEIRGSARSGTQVEADVYILDEADQVVMEMRKVSAHKLPEQSAQTSQASESKTARATAN
jgi:malonyl CoA-acyl carrier protein transacylase